MATVNTPASIAAAANALIPMVGTLNASGDPAKQAKAATLDQAINDALTQASNLAAADVVQLLSGAGPEAQLQKLDAQAQAAAAQIAKEEAKVDNAISFLTSAVTFVGSVATGNALSATTQLGNMLNSLSIR
jgi:hypothetical protein